MQSKSLPESVRQTITASALLIIVVILFVFVGNFGVSKVLGVRSQVKSAQNSEAILTQKLDLLKTISNDAALKANIVASAVPEANPSLTVISQLKLVAAANGVVMSVIKSVAGTTNATGVNEANISFTVEGTRDQIFTFLTSVANISPITLVTEIEMTETAGSARADVSVKSFWADFPKTIPSVSEPIVDLTADEKAILAKVSGLTQPTFVEISPSTEVNTNPFGQ